MNTSYSETMLFNVIFRIAQALIFFAFAFMALALVQNGNDFINYVNYFIDIKTFNFSAILTSRLEPAFGILVLFFTYLFDTEYFIYLSILLLSLLIKMLVLTKWHLAKSAIILVLIVYLFRFYPLHELTQVRLALSLSFWMLAIESEKKWSFFYSIVGCLIHFSTLALIPSMVIIYYTKNNAGHTNNRINIMWLLNVLATTITSIIIIRSIDLIAPNLKTLQMYSETSFGDSNINLFSIGILIDLTFIVGALLIKKHLNQICMCWIYINAIGILLFFTLADYPVMAFRFRELFSFFMVYLIKDAFKLNIYARLYVVSWSIVSVIAYYYLYFISFNSIF